MKIYVACVINKRWLYKEFPGSSADQESACNAGDSDSTPGLGSSPGEGNDNPLYDSCLEKSMDRGAWWATVHGVAEGRTRWVTKHRQGKDGELNKRFKGTGSWRISKHENVLNFLVIGEMLSVDSPPLCCTRAFDESLRDQVLCWW